MTMAIDEVDDSGKVIIISVLFPDLVQTNGDLVAITLRQSS